ncbi:MAG: hypothetical protein OXG44_15065 [Gammaproteobacteria bacterium]|nr:hypothetical protein [Gammaproteobacteria bacterium]
MADKHWYGVTHEATSVEVPCAVCGCRGWIDKKTLEFHRDPDRRADGKILCALCFARFFQKTGKVNPEDTVLSDRPEVKFPWGIIR